MSSSSTQALAAGDLQRGLACTLLAGLLWGLVFIAPVLLPSYPAMYLSVARYFAFGLIALGVMAFQWRGIRELTRQDWLAALELSVIGNLLYYGFLAAAIQTAGAPLPTMIIGSLPVVISICANLHQTSLPWKKLALPLALISLGIALVHRAEWQHLQAQPLSPQDLSDQTHRLWVGAALALAAVACWTWYPIRNTRWLQRRPHISSATWASAQGLATLPLAALGIAVLVAAQLGWLGIDWRPLAANVTDVAANSGLPAPSISTLLLGPTPLLFLGLMLAIGLGASWLGTLLWNRASQLLPASLTGQLIVFETLAALLYAFIHRSAWPNGLTWLGMLALVAGVVLGVRAFQQNTQAA